MSTYEAKKLLVYKPVDQVITQDILKKIKSECASEFIFSIHRDLEKNLWYCGTGGATNIQYSHHLFTANKESILVFGDALYPNAPTHVCYRPQSDKEDWVMVAGIGKHTFLTSQTEGMKVFFDYFLSFLDHKGIVKLLKKVVESCPGTAYVVVNKNGPKIIGNTWEEKDGISYSSTAFFDKLSYEQRNFGKCVLAYLAGDKFKEEMKRLTDIGEAGLVQELKKNKELFEKILTL